MKRLQALSTASFVAAMLLAFAPIQVSAEAMFDERILLVSQDIDLQVHWATRFEHGEGVDRDLDTANRLYCAAARQGSVEAQSQLAWLYAQGRGVERDDSIAAAWYRLAADQGDQYSQRMLGLLGEHPVVEAHCALPEAATRSLVAQENLRSAPPVIVGWVTEMAPEFGLDPYLVLAIIKAESNFRVNAVSPKNAQGLMQLIPDTARRFGVTNTMNPKQNIRGGMAYLRWLLAYFDGDVRLAAAGYNAGEGAVVRYKGIPPYRETRNYVKKVIGLYGLESHSVVASIVEPSSVLFASNTK